MAKARVIHSDDACTIIFNGDPSSPEPHHGIIKFPGGVVEVARCSDGTYWAHIARFEESTVIGGRIDRDKQGSDNVLELPEAELINHIALRIKL